MNPPGSVLESERLILRELREEDLDLVAPMLAHPEVMRFWPGPLSRAESAEWIRAHRERYARHGHGYWLALEKATGACVGQAGVLTLPIEGSDVISLGYILDRRYWGRGFATEAAAACRDHAFDVVGAERIVVPIRPENAASVAVAVRVGLHREGRTTYAGFVHDLYTARSARGSRAG